MHLPRRNNKINTNSSCFKQHFIPIEGIDVRVLRNYIAYNFGDNIALKPAVNTQDGKEGYIINCSIPFRPKDVELLQEQSQELRHAEKLHYQDKHLEKLHQGWVQHQHYLDHEAEVQAINSVPTQRIDRNLPIPFLDLPPTYNDIEGLHINKRAIQPLQPTLPEDNGIGPGQRPRAVSCSDMVFFSPSGGFYPDGYSGSEDEATGSHEPMLSGAYESTSVSQSLQGNNSDLRFSRPASMAIYSSSSLQPTSSFDRSRFAQLGRARSTTSLRSNNYGLAHHPSQRAGAAGEELFLGTQNNSDYGSSQQQGTLVQRAPLSARAYSDGRPVWT